VGNLKHATGVFPSSSLRMLHITGNKKQGEERAPLFAVRVHVIVMLIINQNIAVYFMQLHVRYTCPYKIDL
jgi:hypothetical protein